VAAHSGFKPSICDAFECRLLRMYPALMPPSFEQRFERATHTGQRKSRYTSMESTLFPMRRSIDPDVLERRFLEAIASFWSARSKNREEQQLRGTIDQGNRAEVTGGTQLGALELLIVDLLVEAGLDELDVRTRTRLEIPGYFRSEKKWDLLVVTKSGEANRLILAIELKSMAGSTGKNLNNRAEEIIGNAVDLQTAYREHRFGHGVPRPFVGFLVLVEDLAEVNTPVKSAEPYFSVDPIFTGKTYAERWNVLCQRLMSESLYTAACCELITRDPGHRAIATLTSFHAFAAAVEGHAYTIRETIQAERY